MQILRFLRFLDGSNSDSLFNIPALDKILVHAGNTELRQQLYSEEYLQLDALRKAIPKPTVLEITSEEPGAGKTHLLYLITTLAVLPQSHDDISLNGKHSAVVVLDTDERFSVERLAQVMRHYINQQTQARNAANKDPNKDPPHAPSEARITELISRSLQHAHIFRPQTLASATATLSSLPSHLLNASTHHSTARPLHAILIDSLTAFHGPARAAAAAARTAGSSAPYEAPYAALTAALQAQATRFGAAIVGTSAAQGSGSGSGRGADEAVVLRPWPALRPQRLRVARVPVPRVAPRLSVQEALRERGERAREVERGRFEAVGEGGARFGFCVRAEGVVVDLDADAGS